MRLLDLGERRAGACSRRSATQGTAPAPSAPSTPRHTSSGEATRAAPSSAAPTSAHPHSRRRSSGTTASFPRATARAFRRRSPPSRNYSPIRTPGRSTPRGSSAIANDGPSSAPSSKPRTSVGGFAGARGAERGQQAALRALEDTRSPAARRAWSSWRQGSARPGSRRSTRAGRSSAACCSSRTGKRF